MSREKLIGQLSDYLSRWGEEYETVQRFIDFVSSRSDCFERELSVGHVTGSAWVVNKECTHVLLTHHRKLNRWLQLGGHADGDSNTLHVALREVEEESGLERIQPIGDEIFDVDIHRIPARGHEAEHFHYDVRYAVQSLGDDHYKVSDESHDLGWIEIRNLDRVTDEVSMLRMAEKWKRRVGLE